MDIKSTTALVTGAAGGLGTAISRRLAQEGARVVLSGRNEAALRGLLAQLPGQGHAVVTADLAQPGEAVALLQRAEAAAGPLDLVVNNAGVVLPAVYHDLEAAEVERMIALNLTAPMLLTHAAIPGMLERGRGHVVQIAAIGGVISTAYCEPYAATKGGLLRFNDSLRATYADAPIGFSAVCPGFTTGGGIYSRMEAEGITSNVMLGTTTVEKVANAVVNAVRHDRPRPLVNSRPLAPVAAISALAPRLGARLVERTGGNGVFRRVAAARETSKS
jgi:short-subunit dehydrogenase